MSKLVKISIATVLLGGVSAAVWFSSCASGDGSDTPVGGQAGSTTGPSSPYYANMTNVLGTTAQIRVRGRIVEPDDDFMPSDATPFKQMSQDELKNMTVSLQLAGNPPVAMAEVGTDGEGYIAQTIDISPLQLPVGLHVVQVLVGGQLAGQMTMRLLDPASSVVVVRSDVDMTYLKTDFMSTLQKLDLLGQTGAERAVLPAMETVYPALRHGASGVADVPLTFLSGSPQFFKIVLEVRMGLDAIAQDGLVLKPFKDIVVDRISDVDVGGIVPALEEQIGYKLTALLQLRLDVPVQTQEILMGDDTEADVAIYNLYHRLTSGALDGDGLMAELDAHGVDASWKGQVATLVPLVVQSLATNPAPPVQAIYINQTPSPGDHFPVADWKVPDLTRYHSGAWPLMLDLFEDQRVSSTAVGATRDRLRGQGLTQSQLDDAAAAGLAEGFLTSATVDAF